MGNHKDRPDSPRWSHFDTGFLDALAAEGARPEDVDLVINTHLHGDHVGWNTRLVDGAWVPTFPNATYLNPSAELEFWDPERGPRRGRGNRNVFEDSVAPVRAAGRVRSWDGGHRIDRNLRLDPAPGARLGGGHQRPRAARALRRGGCRRGRAGR